MATPVVGPTGSSSRLADEQRHAVRRCFGESVTVHSVRVFVPARPHAGSPESAWPGYPPDRSRQASAVDDPLTVVRGACNAADSRDWETNRAASTSGASTGPELEATSHATRQSLPIVRSVTRSVLGSSEIPWSAMMHVRPWRWRTTGRHDRDFLRGPHAKRYRRQRRADRHGARGAHRRAGDVSRSVHAADPARGAL